MGAVPPFQPVTPAPILRSMKQPTLERIARARWLRWLRGTTAVAAVVVGGFIVLATATLGHCSAFGGRCPRGSSSIDAEVFWGVAAGTAIAVGVPLWMRSPSRRGLLRALLIAAPVALLVGLALMEGARG